MDQRMQRGIKTIPGDDGWWHSSSEETYQELGAKLHEHGVPAETIVEILTSAYGAAAAEFGQ